MDKIIAGAVGSFISCYVCTMLITGRLLYRQEHLKIVNYIIILAAVPLLRIGGSFNIIYKIIYVISIYTIIINLIYKKGFIFSSIICVLAYSIGLLCDVINSFIYLTIFNIDIVYIKQHPYLTYSMYFTFFLIVLIISRFIRYGNLFDEIEDFIFKKNLFSAIQYISFFVLFTVILAYIISVQPYLSKQHLLSTALLVLFIIMNITYFIQIKISTKSKYDYDNIYNYTNEVEKLAKQLSAQEHEYKNRLIGIEALVENKQYDDSLEFINDILSVQNKKVNLNLTNYDNIYDVILKKLLIEKTARALGEGIKINTDIRTQIKDINVPNIVLNDIVSIIFDNAIDASSKSKERIIDIMIDEDEDEINIIIANTYSKIIEEVVIYHDWYFSKGIFKGNGLSILKQIEKDNLNIIIDTSITEDLFIQEINIFNAKETI
ncbi:GHKL domain-containing protein [Sedimentibacter hydroxybenzoicus DSM 7310]|uniref:GHKL domain-containing protein n=1 Tax=Sedimentibacter hydroxybenzoicus DSM 7310 TaxID=1123245 RepID=A0A974BJ01_SEDHY|nr:GHKL domain-containing protein [Sedimentibacter hydroxybenzoicus]NYB74129.1 GHKL domain-containing protein [Sedimentibacter hydroxybenzoicus DSM 7310]